jgi:heme exporter protein B
LKHFLDAAHAVFAKDLAIELRTRVAVNALLLFAICCLVLVAFVLGPTRLVPEDRGPVHSVLSGLSRGFVKEEESGTAAALKLTAPSGAVFLGKLVANLLLLGVIGALVVPLFLGMMGFDLAGPRLFFTLLALGLYGLSAAATFTAAIVAKASAKGALFAVLSIPILLPVLIPAVLGTGLAARSDVFSEGAESIRLLVAYDGVITVAGFMLFDVVWRD